MLDTQAAQGYSCNRIHRKRKITMPTISMFFGILIRMYFFDDKQHHAPHIHAECQGQQAVYLIETGERISGNMPPTRKN